MVTCRRQNVIFLYHYFLFWKIYYSIIIITAHEIFTATYLYRLSKWENTLE